MRRTIPFVLVLLAPLAAQAADPKPYVYDPAAARDINRTCAACHGEFGEGGGGGVYPRLAGLNKDYIAEQLRRFKSRERENIPMIPYATERELPERDVQDIAQYLSEIKLANRPPPLEGAMDGYARLMQLKQVVQIPQEPGDAELGKRLYNEGCAECHGAQGQGRVKKPPLAGQHMSYLKAQVKSFLDGRRPHEDMEELIKAKTDDQWKALYAYISLLDD